MILSVFGRSPACLSHVNRVCLMLSNALCPVVPAIASAAEAGVTPMTQPDPNQVFSHPLLTGILAVGICTLTVWVVRRAVNRYKLRLRRVPGRPNSLTPGHVLLVLGAYLAPSAILHRSVPDFSQQTQQAVSLAAQVAWLLLSLMVAKLTFRHGLGRGLGLSMRHWLYDSARGVVGYLAVMPVCLAVTMMLPRDAGDLHLLLRTLPGMSVPWKLLTLLSGVVLAPLAEEVFFRGLVQSMLRRYLNSAWLSVAIASAFFAVVHVPQWKDMPALFVLAVALGYNYERCGRLYPSILMHAVFNAVMFAVVLSMPSGA
jgi:hypothetical protein